MRDFITDRHELNLPDCYKKTEDSNNHKILEIERLTVNEYRETLQQLLDVLDLDSATGATLDLYGETVGQSRGVATDAQYIVLIKSRIYRNLSNGSYKSILTALSKTFSCDPSLIEIVETENPCVVAAVTLPLSVIVEAGFSTSQTIAIIKSLLPICITLESYLFEGTFEFSSTESEYDANTGFCDVEGGTLGGYLGVTEGDEHDPILPI